MGLPTPATLTYDDAGRAKTQSVTGGASYEFSYDDSGNLVKADDTAGGVDIEHAYDVDGIRVARKAGNEITPYVAGGEITNPGTGTVTARRTFTAPAGTPLALQATGAGGTGQAWTWLFADTQHTMRLSKNATTGASTHLAYFPVRRPHQPRQPAAG